MFRRQWKQFITHPQRFLRVTHGRFLHIVNELAADDTQASTAFLYLSQDEFSALSEIAKEVRRKVATCPTSNASTERPLFYPMSLPRTPHLMLDDRKPLLFQYYVLFIYIMYYNPLLSSASSLRSNHGFLLGFTLRALPSA